MAEDAAGDVGDAAEGSTVTTGSGTTTASGHVIVCGMGHLGYRIVQLLARLGQHGIVITQRANDDWRLAAEAHFAVILGDARREELLRRAGIERAKAILVVTDDDLANVSIALDARRMNPAIAITVRLFDQELAVHFEKSAHVDRALSTSALAAPAFMAAVLGDSVRGAFEADCQCWLLRDQQILAGSSPDGITISQWARQTGCAPLALARGQQIHVLPTAQTTILPGDVLTSLGPAPCHRGPLPTVACCNESRSSVLSVRRLIAAIRDSWRAIPLALRTARLVLLAVMALSVAVFHFALDLPVADSVYFVVTTITTVGYGDYSLKDAPVWIKLYGTFLMLCGAAILAVLFSIVTDFVLQIRLRDVIARRPSRSKGHILVAGLGKIGFRLVRDLVRNGESVVAIECREQGPFVQAARELIPVVLGNAKTEETLRKAGVSGAKAVIAVTDDDLANLSIGLAAKRTSANCCVVLRIFDSTLADKMEHALDVNAVLSASAAAAPTFIGSAICPDVVQGIVLRDCLVLVFHHRVAADSPHVGTTAARLGENGAALLIKPAGASAYRFVDTDDRLRKGDRVLGTWWYPLNYGLGKP